MLIAVPVTLVTLKAYQKLGKPEPPSTTVADSLVGREGIVTVDTDPETLKGKVRVGSDVWSARSSEPLEKGTEVIVESAEGVHVTVKRK